jgi:hypothetical protein
MRHNLKDYDDEGANMVNQPANATLIGNRGSIAGWGALKCAPESRKWLRGLDLKPATFGL